MKVIIISNTFDSVSRLRGTLVKSLVASSVEVLCVAPLGNSVSGEGPESVEAMGARVAAIPMSAAAISPLRDLLTICSIAKIVWREKPDAVLTYTVKPNTFGVLGARLAQRRGMRIVSIMNGLGYSFLSTGGWRARLLGTLVTILYRLSFRFSTRVFFHNQHDLDLFVSKEIIPAGKGQVVPGSGVDTDYYQVSPLSTEPFIFLLVGRLIREKGIYEYVQAARIIKSQHPEVIFGILGPYYDSPSAIRPEEISDWQKEGIIEYWGQYADVRPSLKKCTVLVLPSYREGLSRVLLEGMASGRPLVVSDVPGCQELVIQGKNGYLAKSGDSVALAAAFGKIISKGGDISAFGRASREIAVAQYDSRISSEIISRALGVSEAR